MIANSILGAAVLAILGWINYRLGGSFQYPPALFAWWWSLLLAALACSGSVFFPISPATLAIYLAGPCAMTAGGLIALALGSRSLQERRRAWECREGFITASIVLLGLAFPALWYRIGELSAMSGVSDFWVGVRYQTMHPDRADSTLGVFEYLIFFSTMLAFVALEDFQRRKIGLVRALAAVALSLIYHLVTASRLGALILISGLVGIALLHSRRMVIPLLVGTFALIAVFVAVSVVLKKGIQQGEDLAANTASLARSFQLYALGGLVAFESAVDTKTAPDSQGRTYRSLYAVARASGYEVEIPSLVSHYTYTPTPTNVYTMYYPYLLDFGRAGVMVLLCILGLIFSLVYLEAESAAGPFTVGYGLVFAYLVLSSADEYVFSLLSMNCQAVLYLLLLYRRSRPRVWNAAFA